ncbi:MAG: alpha/beta hydrolase [Pseudomonadota bacterium]
MSESARAWKVGLDLCARLVGIVGVLSLASVAQGVAPPAAMEAPGALEARFLAPAGLKFDYMTVGDARRLRYAHWSADGSVRTVVVLVTGFSESIEKYYETLHDLHRPGTDLWVLDWRGQGGSDRLLAGAERERGYSTGFDADVDDLTRFIGNVVRPAVGIPTVLVSHSMGGVIALRYLEEHPGGVSAAIFSAPALSVGAERGWRRALEHAYVWLGAHLGFASAYLTDQHDWLEATDTADGLSHDRLRGGLQKRWFAANPALRVGGVTFGWMEALYDSADVAMDTRRLAQVTTPVLFGVPLADPIANPATSLAVCAQLHSCRAWRADGAWHELFVESDRWRSPWIDAVVGFLPRQ